MIPVIMTMMMMMTDDVEGDDDTRNLDTSSDDDSGGHCDGSIKNSCSREFKKLISNIRSPDCMMTF